jgi:threonylcarbamoyladenosine tRNA methylthiotransferase CDKAL1
LFSFESVPGITIATDLILGFPTETAENFEQTMRLIEKYNFPSLFINQFYPRPGTPAAKMTLIHPNKVRERTKRASAYFRSYFPYQNRVGQVYTALVTEVSADKQFYVAHNTFYEQILIPKDDYYLGKMVKVRIVSISKYSMIGELVDSAGCLVRIADRVQKNFNFDFVLRLTVVLTSALLLYRFNRSKLL